jgi:hypothetical protein
VPDTRFFFAASFFLLGLAFTRCCGGLFATTSTARSKRDHASDSSLTSFAVLDFIMTAPKSEKGPSAELEEYWSALGRFADVFALVEHDMQLTLWHCAKVKKPVAQAIFSGTRIDAASGLIKRISEAKRWSQTRRKRLDIMLSQLGEITRVRNDILHYGGLPLGNEWTVSNMLYAHIQERVRTTKITPKILDNLSADLITICIELQLMRDLSKVPDWVQKENRMPPVGAWHYKPERQQGTGQKPPKPRQKQPSRPRSSQA